MIVNIDLSKKILLFRVFSLTTISQSIMILTYNKTEEKGAD